ncbi:MAG: hypothetical protein K2K29_02390 [Muribaculaceae bacterium]|nr:hypothetical protein [Muribaculaceae bacterium]
MKRYSNFINTHKIISLLLGAILTSASAFAQSSAPAPGSGGGFGGGGGWGGTSAPAPGAGGNFQPNMGGPGPGMGPAWGGPWGGGWSSSPSVIVNINPGIPQNSGVTNVVGVGYDAQGIWRTIPMTVSYNYVGAQYNVTVLNAWNPWTDFWNRGIDQPAYNTSYLLRGTMYNFYTVLSTGTYYFNL